MLSICPISNEYTFTFTGVRQDDGGQPEELIAVVNKFGFEGDFSVETYDTRYDNDFTFIGFKDGTYKFTLTGGVSGIVMVVDFLVDHNTRRSISQLVKDDVDEMICGSCDQGEAYILVRSLLESSYSLIECGVAGESGENITADDALSKVDLVLKSGCETKLCGGGC